MVAHQAVGVYQPIKAVTDTAGHIEKKTPVAIPEVYVLSPVTPRGDVIQRTPEFKAKRSCHTNSSAKQRKKERPDPFFLFFSFFSFRARKWT